MRKNLTNKTKGKNSSLNFAMLKEKGNNKINHRNKGERREKMYEKRKK